MQVHHPFYLKGRNPWEYEVEDVRVLCPGCHVKMAALEEQFIVNALRYYAKHGSNSLRLVLKLLK